MNYIAKKLVNYNGQDLLLTTMDIEYAFRRTLTVKEINDSTADAFNSSIRELARESKDPITIYINSPGGSVTAGMSMYDTLKSCGCQIITVAIGMAASMGAFLLAAAGTKGLRYATKTSKILIHQPSGGTSGQVSDMKIHVENIINTKEHLNRILSECTGQPIAKIEADCERDYILNAQGALSYGLIDVIGDPIEGC